MRVGICDDNEQARCMVSGWLKARPEIAGHNVFEFSCGEALLEHLRRFVLDIVFLDCKMDGMDGIETAKAIRRRDNRLIIILLTDFTGYARFGYDADILSYILKSEFTAKADNVFGKAVKRIKENALKTYAIRTGNGLFHLEIAEILYIESHERKKELVMRSGQTYEFYGRIEDIETDLKRHGFIRPHNSYLVNGGHVRIFKPHGVWLADRELPLPVSRGRYKQAYDDMTVYAAEVRL